jgi:hypothetical protein
MRSKNQFLVITIIGFGLGAIFNTLPFLLLDALLPGGPIRNEGALGLVYLFLTYILLIGPSWIGAVLAYAIGTRQKKLTSLVCASLAIFAFGVILSIALISALIMIFEGILGVLPISWTLGFKYSVWFLWTIWGFIIGLAISFVTQMLANKDTNWINALPLALLGVIAMGTLFPFVQGPLLNGEPKSFSPVIIFTGLQLGMSIIAAVYATVIKSANYGNDRSSE